MKKADAVRGISVDRSEISWGQAYERRMWRFNLKVVLFALIALALCIAWGGLADLFFSRIVFFASHSNRS
jgi:hypothetical protein